MPTRHSIWLRRAALVTGILSVAPQISATPSLHVSDGRFALINSVGIASATIDFDSSSRVQPLSQRQLEAGESLRLTFTVSTEDDAAESSSESATITPVQPHQAMILWQSQPSSLSEPARNFMSVVKVRKGGKAKWEMEIARSPSEILSLSSGPVTASLLIGSPETSKALRIELGSFVLPSVLVLPFPYPSNEKLPKAWENERHSKMPEIEWTFRPLEKRVKTVVALGGTLVVLAPWVVFAGILTQLELRLTAPSTNVLLFLVSITAFEALIFFYWTSLKLLLALPYFGALALVTAATGRRALGDLRTARNQVQIKASKSE
ncbi:hypothetical protein OIO90_002119 [Microbotryomycetes sp. JL221]|nr:hypothetical protein OIO90_002119 [Microbotryomycetes sp. JL221]